MFMMQPLPMMVLLNLELEEWEVVAVEDLNNNSFDPNTFSDSESSNISVQPASNQDLTMENAMDMEEVLDFEPSKEEEQEVTVVAKEAEEVVKEKKKRQRRGRAVLRKQQEEHNEAEEEEETPDTVTVSSSEWEEMEEMKKTMKELVERLAVCERALKRAATREDGGTPGKRIHPPIIRDK